MDQDQKKILIIEDDPLIREMVTEILEDRGYKVFCADDGDVGLELLEKIRDVGVVITDIFMPNKEGIGVIRAVKNRFPGIKVIAVTGAVNHQKILDTAHEFGADLTIKKPFDIDEFADNVTRIFAA